MIDRWAVYAGDLLLVLGALLFVPGLKDNVLLNQLFVNGWHSLHLLGLGALGVLAGIMGERAARVFFQAIGLYGVAVFLLMTGASLVGGLEILGLGISKLGAGGILLVSALALFLGFESDVNDEWQPSVSATTGGSTFVRHR